MTDIFEPCLMTTGIGSVPLADPDQGAAGFGQGADLSRRAGAGGVRFQHVPVHL